MAKKYPSQKHTTLILAEDLRSEVRGKITLTGIYAARYIRVFDKPSDDKPAVLRLLFVFFFRDGQGEFDVKVKIIQPDGSELTQVDMDQISKSKNSSMTVAVCLPTANITMLGNYKITAFLDEKAYKFDFNIELGEKS